MDTVAVKTIVTAIIVALLTAFGLAAPAGAATPRTNDGNYHPLTPTRVADSRIGVGTAASPLAVGTNRVIDPTSAGVPGSGVSAVVVTITAVGASGRGWFTAYPDGSAMPATSTLNFRGGWTGATTATVPVSSAGRFRLAAAGAPSHFLVDVIGYYSTAAAPGTGSLLNDQEPMRIYDTRAGARIMSGQTVRQRFNYADSSGGTLTALVLNLTSVAATDRGWLTAWPGGGQMPNVSTLNYAKGEISPNTTIVPVRNEGGGVYSYAITAGGPGATHLIIDQVGLYSTANDGDGLAYSPMTPTRLVDTRSGIGTAKARLKAGETRQVSVPAARLTPTTAAFAANITGVGASTTSWLSAWSGGPDISTSTVNFGPGQDRANTTVLSLRLRTATGRPTFAVRNGSGTADVIVDVTGRFVRAADGGRAPSTTATRTPGTQSLGLPQKMAVSGVTAWVGTDRAHLVSAPSGIQQLRAIVPTGTKVVGDLRNGWLRITSGAYAGEYVNGDWLSTYDPANPARGTTGAATVAAPGTTVTRSVLATNYNVKIRSAASYTATVIASVTQGATFTGSYVNGDWFRISAGTYSGRYISAAVLNRTETMSSWNGKIPAADLCPVPAQMNSSWEPRVTRYLNCTALRGLVALDAAYKAKFGVSLLIAEGYRDAAKQTFFFDLWGYPSAAYPGTSTHGIGRAIDLHADVTSPYWWGRPADVWLTANSQKYGWDRPPYYDSIGGSSEYWHYNFVG